MYCICTALTMYCTYNVLHLLCTALTMYCTHYVLYCLYTALIMYCTHHVLTMYLLLLLLILSSADNDPGLLSIPEVTQRRLTACTMDAGLCNNWNQDTGDNFDWTLTSESTPTSNTGPSDSSGGEGAFMFIEARMQPLQAATLAAALALTTTCMAEEEEVQNLITEKLQEASAHSR